MLVLNRQVGERIVINDNIVVKVVDVRGGNVRLGFEAPPDVKIHREEIWHRIQNERGDAGGSQSNV